MSDRTADSSGGESAPGAGPNEPESREVSILEVVNLVLRHRKVVFVTPLVTVFLVVAVTVLLPDEYTSESTFMPHSDQPQAGALTGLASQFGVSIPLGQPGQSPQFYADLVMSRKLLKSVVTTGYELEPGEADDPKARRGDLVELFEIDEPSRGAGVAEAIDELEEHIGVAITPETGVVELEVTEPSPHLAHQITARILELVNEFNLERRQSQASAERKFLETQLERARADLHAAEDSLEHFLVQNRSYQNSPTLQFEYDRLQRRVSRHQQLFTSLTQSYQQAAINEVRNTPVITVVDPPEVPPVPDERQLPLKGLLGLVVGGILAVVWIVGWEVMATSRKELPDQHAEFRRLVAQPREEFQQIWRRLTGWFRSP